MCTFALTFPRKRCPDGGIGRRVGLKHQWMQVLVGSIPTLGTYKKANRFTSNLLAFFAPYSWRVIGEIINFNVKSTLFGVNLQGAICNQNIAFSNYNIVLWLIWYHPYLLLSPHLRILIFHTLSLL